VNIKIKGKINQSWGKYFDGMTIQYNQDITIFSGQIKDYAHMYGMINRMRDLNLKLISANTSN